MNVKKPKKLLVLAETRSETHADALRDSSRGTYERLIDECIFMLLAATSKLPFDL